MSFRKILAARNAWAILAISSIVLFRSPRVAGDGMLRLQGHVDYRKLHGARFLGNHDAGDSLKLAITLKPRDPAGLEDFLRRVQDPNDSLYHHYLTLEEFADRFGPSESDVRDVAAHLERFGVRVTDVHRNRLVLDVEGTSASVENAFQLQMNEYRLASGRVARSANADPIFPVDIASKVHAVVGLDDVSVRRPHLVRPGGAGARAPMPRASIGDYMTPAKIKSAYNLASLTQTGAGETLAFFELSEYSAADIAAYASNFGIPAPTLENVLVDGGPRHAAHPGDPDDVGDNERAEVTLDIELAAAVAPGLTKILVYDGPNTDARLLDTYSKIASENRASVVSVSWGLSEDETSAATRNAEAVVFQQMAAQGQSIFVASGDSGAYDDPHNPNTLSVDDPASQPYVTAVGGTTLYLNAGENTYQRESAWMRSSGGRIGSGGGGVSRVWSLPTWQAAVSTNANGASTAHRMVPDVSLDADPATGYPIYFTATGQSGAWYAIGGTSAAAPIWAAFASLVNQKRVADGHARVGFANPMIYQIAQSDQSDLDFHDVDDGSKNRYYAATIYYDLATGWGSFSGANLFASWTAANPPAALPAPSTPGSFSVGVN